MGSRRLRKQKKDKVDHQKNDTERLVHELLVGVARPYVQRAQRRPKLAMQQLSRGRFFSIESTPMGAPLRRSANGPASMGASLRRSAKEKDRTARSATADPPVGERHQRGAHRRVGNV